MHHGQMIFILGDIHAEFETLNIFINTTIRNNKALKDMASLLKDRGDDFQIIMLQCGDFAWFWSGYEAKGLIKNKIDWLPDGHVPIYWVGGNHEDWDALDKLGTGISEIDPGIFFCPFGTTLEVKPGLTILFAGGAESADKDMRLRKMEEGAPKIWWEQEGISEVDMARLSAVPRADWVISHTAPNAFDIASQLDPVWGDRHFFEPSRGKLEEVFLKYKPKRWFFGHFHQFMQGKIDGCKWECLADFASMDKCWDKVWLEWND